MGVETYPMPMRSLVALACALSVLWWQTPVRPAADSNSGRSLARKPSAAKLVDLGVQFYYEGRYRKALESLQGGLQDAELDQTRRMGALQYQAFCQVALGDSDSARETFARILEIRPDFRLPAGTAPKIFKIFEEVKDSLPPPKPIVEPELQHTPPESGTEGAALTLEARVDNLPPAGQIVVRYRHDPGSPYSRQSMTPRPDGRYTATIPAPLKSGPAELMYYLYVVDGQGQRRAAAGGEDEPFRVAFAAAQTGAEEDGEEESSYHWWIWPVVGAVLLGAGLAIVLSLPGDDEATGSARVTIKIVTEE